MNKKYNYKKQYIKQNKNSDQLTKPKTHFITKIIGICLKLTGLIIIFIVLIIAILASKINKKVNEFCQYANIDKKTLFKTIKANFNKPIQSNYKDKIIILVLGVDSIQKRDSPPLTDTIILLSIDKNQNIINTVSIPRDLWSEQYKTKINSLYFYGLQKDANNPFYLIQNELKDKADLNVDKTLLITLDSLKQLIDIVGGIDVYVSHPFTDNKFPNPNVDPSTTKDPNLLYETISFKQGLNHMDGELALKYIRSRHAKSEQGTDNARQIRQTEVIQALIKKIFIITQNLDTKTLGKLFDFYNKNYAKYIDLPTIIKIGSKFSTNYFNSILECKNQKKLNCQNIDFLTLNSYIINFCFKSNCENASIVHPDPRLYDNQWVFIVKDKNLFKKELYHKLGLENK